MSTPLSGTWKAVAAPLAAFSLAGLIACSGSGPTGASKSKLIDIGDNNPAVILASGDSVTWGYDSTGNSGYRRELERLMAEQGRDVTVVNGGRPGVRSHNIQLVINDINRHKPAVVVLQYGVNDALNDREGTPAAVTANLRNMINAALNNKSITVLTTLTPTCGNRTGQNDTIQKINLNLRNLILEYEEVDSVVFADVAAAFQEADPANGGCDLISPIHQNHPNDSGYRLMASVIARSLERLSW